jgi:hypothetical protein
MRVIIRENRRFGGFLRFVMVLDGFIHTTSIPIFVFFVELCLDAFSSGEREKRGRN